MGQWWPSGKEALTHYHSVTSEYLKTCILSGITLKEKWIVDCANICHYTHEYILRVKHGLYSMFSEMFNPIL